MNPITPRTHAEERSTLEKDNHVNALEGDATLFTRGDGIEAAWRVIDPILQEWQTDTAPSLASYAPGSWGPESADDLLACGGRKWRYSCAEHD